MTQFSFRGVYLSKKREERMGYFNIRGDVVVSETYSGIAQITSRRIEGLDGRKKKAW